MAGPTQTVVSGTWPIYTTGGGPLYVDFYNGVAAISGSAGFWGFIALVATCGLFGALLYAAWSSKFKAAFQWLMWLVISYNFLFTVTTTVQIIDPVYPALPGALVANVPFGLAFLDSVTTTSGRWFRQTYETVFSLPNDVTYGSHGMLFGASLMMASQQAQVPSSDFASNLSAYMQQCVMYDISTGVIPMDQLTAAADLWTFVTTTYPPNPGLSVDYIASSARSIISCPQMVTNLNQGWPNQLSSGQQTLAQRLFPQNDPVTANSLMLSALPATTQYLVGVSRTSSQILQQAMMMNMVDSSMRGAAAGSDATAALNAYTDATTSLTTLQSQQAAGRAATKWLPLMKIILELSYVALFMISFPLTMISVGQARQIMIGYLSGFVTVAAFEPIFAFMHRIAMGNGAWDSAAAAVNADGTINITLATVTGIAGASADMAASGNYMLFAIPTIAAGILGGTHWAASAATTALYSPQRAAQQAGSQAERGNISVGNTSFDNESIGNSSEFQVNHDPQFRAGSTRFEGAHGEIQAIHGDGTRTVDASGTVSQLPVTLNGRDQLGAEFTRRAGQEQSVGQQLSTEAANTQASSTSQAIDFFDQRSKAGGWSQHDRETFGANNVSAMERSSDLVNQFAKDHSIGTQEAAKVMQTASAGVKLPDFLGISAGFGGSVEHMNANDKSRLYRDAQDFTARTGFRQSLDTAVSAIRDKADESSDTRVQQLGQRLTADQHQTQQLTQSAREHFDRSRQYSEAATETQSQGEEFNRNMNDQFIQYLADRTNPHTGVSYGMEGATRMILSRDAADRAYVDVIGKDFISEEASRRADALPQAQVRAAGTTRADYDNAAGGIAAGGTPSFSTGAVLSAAGGSGLGLTDPGRTTNVDRELAGANRDLAGAQRDNDEARARAERENKEAQETGILSPTGVPDRKVGGVWKPNRDAFDLSRAEIQQIHGGSAAPSLGDQIQNSRDRVTRLQGSGAPEADILRERQHLASLEATAGTEEKKLDRLITRADHGSPVTALDGQDRRYGFTGDAVSPAELRTLKDDLHPVPHGEPHRTAASDFHDAVAASVLAPSPVEGHVGLASGTDPAHPGSAPAQLFNGVSSPDRQHDAVAASILSPAPVETHTGHAPGFYPVHAGPAPSHSETSQHPTLDHGAVVGLEQHQQQQVRAPVEVDRHSEHLSKDGATPDQHQAAAAPEAPPAHQPAGAGELNLNHAPQVAEAPQPDSIGPAPAKKRPVIIDTSSPGLPTAPAGFGKPSGSGGKDGFGN